MVKGFEWDEDKNRTNQQKHGVSFEAAVRAFYDTHRVIRPDITHSQGERRYFCFGRVDGGILTVRFTWREETIRIFGAAYWRKGKKLYEQENHL